MIAGYTGADESRWTLRTSNLPLLSPALSERFIAFRRDGLSSRSLDNYRLYLRLASEVVGTNVSGQEIQRFITNRKCTNGTRAYYQR